ncbi:Ferredoxin 2Fe-2S [Salmonella enterica subsp. enterica serovar Rubislaw str. A4-653]|uniref:2Fe-2S ferredoxin n=1 Tax=Salmonella enterica subsp. enterica serovar Rubislaw str. A4-653 TaxID=913081 RepID=G5QMN0_SALRU|nr:Ferredoxin 2Fe-2S [Salmonella enterica subsp. enterica serovar Rubislaw str. A4-653]
MAQFWKLRPVKPFLTLRCAYGNARARCIALRNGIEIEHACEKSCACTTCHCIVREGFDSLPESSEEEDDMLDKAWGLEPESRLSCQARVTDDDLVIEIPRYTINHAREH